MSGEGGSSQPAPVNTTTTVQNNEPPSYAKPSLELASKEAKRLYEAGEGFKPYTGDLVIDRSDKTNQGTGMLEQGASQFASDFNRPMEFARQTLDNQGFTAPQNQTIDHLSGLVNGQGMGMNDASFRDVLGQSQDAARDAVNDMAMKSGRVDSAAHQGVMAQEVGDLTSRMLMGQLGQDRARQDNAAQSLFNAGQQGQTNMFGAASSIPGAYDASQAGARTLMSLGSMDEDLATREANELLRLHNEGQNENLQRLANFSALATGNGQIGGSSTSTATAPAPPSNQPSTFQNMAGGAMMGYGAGGGLLGAGLGAGAGLLF